MTSTLSDLFRSTSNVVSTAASHVPAAAPFLAGATVTALLLSRLLQRSRAEASRSEGTPSIEDAAKRVIRQFEGTFGFAIRKHFALDFDHFTFLNHGSYGTCPKSVLKEAIAQVLRIEAFPDDFMRRKALGDYQAVCDTVGRFVSAPDGSVVLVENATAAVNTVLRSLPLAAGDVMLINDNTYNACRLAVEDTASRAGATVASFRIELPLAGEEALLRHFEDALRTAAGSAPGGRIRFALLDHIASPTALLFPLERLLPIAKRYAELVMVDGAHAPGMLPLDMARLAAAGCDFYCGNLHKWCFAMKGCAFLFVRPGADGLQERQQSLVISHFALRPNWRERFFMQGTNDQSRYLSVPSALDFMRRELGGVRDMRLYNTALCQAATAMLCRTWGTGPLLAPELSAPFMRAIETPLDYRCFMAAQREGKRALDSLPHAEALPLAMKDGSINERVATDIFLATGIQGQFVFWVVEGRGRIFCRISCQVYNTMEDYARIGKAVTDLHASLTGSRVVPRDW